MINNRVINLRLSHNMVGQILDGLEIRAEAWEATQEYLETGIAIENVILEECNDSKEADAIAIKYREIIGVITKQSLCNI